MARPNYSANKRRREADKARKKREKADRRARQRENRQGTEPGVADESESPQNLPAVPLSEISITGVAKRTKEKSKGGRGPARLFVGGLSYDTGEAELREAFKVCGEIIDVVIITDRDTGRSRGFGFVTYGKSSEAQDAIARLDDAELDGRRLRVRPATER